MTTPQFLLSLDPPLPQGVPGRISANATLVFEVELRKMKLSREHEAEATATPPT